LVIGAVTSCNRASPADSVDRASSADVDAGSLDKVALLRAFGQCAAGTFDAFRAAASDWDGAMEAFVANGTPQAEQAARQAWIRAAEAWQQAELMSFGPSAPVGTPGGQQGRDAIYAWPFVSQCLIEQQIVDQAYDKPEFANALASSRGLSAAEYLLFYEGADNACPPSSSINASGAWRAIDSGELKRRKLAYARVIAAQTRKKSEELAQAWTRPQGNFVETLATAGSNSVYSTQAMAFNAVSQALFYVDDMMKNAKVGKPAGFSLGCASAPCLADVESPWARQSKAFLRQNFDAFDKLFRGCASDRSGLGWDDLLAAVGAESTSSKLRNAIDDARRALDALTRPTFEDDLREDSAGVLRLYESLRTLIMLMKTEFVTVLDLELPKRVEGDND